MHFLCVLVNKTDSIAPVSVNILQGTYSAYGTLQAATGTPTHAVNASWPQGAWPDLWKRVNKRRYSFGIYFLFVRNEDTICGDSFPTLMIRFLECWQLQRRHFCAATSETLLQHVRCEANEQTRIFCSRWAGTELGSGVNFADIPYVNSIPPLSGSASYVEWFHTLIYRNISK